MDKSLTANLGNPLDGTLAATDIESYAPKTQFGELVPAKVQLLGNKAKDVVSKGLGLFGVNSEMTSEALSKARTALLKAIIPAIALVVMRVCLSQFAFAAITYAVATISIMVFLSRLSLMQKELQKAQESAAKIGACNEQLKDQNYSLQEGCENMQTCCQGISEDLGKAQSANDELDSHLSEAKRSREELKQKMEEKDLQQQQELQARDKEIAQLKEFRAASEQHIQQYQDAVKSMSISQEEAFRHLQDMCAQQAKTVSDVLSNVQALADGETDLTDALRWAQQQISEAQSKLSSVMSCSAEITDPDNLRELMASGQLADKAHQIHEASQAAQDILAKLSSGLSEKIIHAQQKIAAARKKTEAEITKLSKQNNEMREQMTASQAKFKEEQSKLSKLQSEYDKYRKQHKDNAEELRKRQEALQKQQKLTSQAQSTAGKTEAAMKKLEADLKKAEQAKEDMRKNLATVQAKMDGMQSILSGHKATIKSQEETIQAQRDNISQLQTQVEDLKKLLEKLETEGASAATLSGIKGMLGKLIPALAIAAGTTAGVAAGAVMAAPLLIAGVASGAAVGAAVAGGEVIRKGAAMLGIGPSGTKSDDPGSDDTQKTEEYAEE